MWNGVFHPDVTHRENRAAAKQGLEGPQRCRNNLVPNRLVNDVPWKAFQRGGSFTKRGEIGEFGEECAL